ncbi:MULTISPECIES: hypothetical protein [Rhodococcus]|uniref:hypothetical protein n=1 Tax=Rhodococcus TaxID=1827 RepID=UPI001F2FF2ED|nr:MULTISPECIES: hypothetical protein [Rhodococcus]MCF8786122.1 hypothetical protein [Rhodococcus ruber]UTM40297.1 hypothetical protein MX572_25665 [Rhodococcus pyridinivorans]
MSERYSPKVGDKVVLHEDFRKPGDKPVVYIVRKINQKTITTDPLSGVGRGVRVAPYGVVPATPEQIAAVETVDPSDLVTIGSLVTVRDPRFNGHVFVVVGMSGSSFKLAVANGDGSKEWKAPSALLEKVKIGAQELLAAAS